MFRGIKGNVRAPMMLLALLVSMVGQSNVALAKSKGRSADVVTGKIAAPTVEDHAAYFSANETNGVTLEALVAADKLRLKTINSIESLLKSKKKSIRRFELLLRLGELHVERHDYLRHVEMEKYSKQYDAWEKTPKAKRGKEPQLDISSSKSAMTRGVNSFRKLVREYPKHRRTDAALFSLAKALARLGKSTAANYFKQLLKSHPRSPLIPDATLALGEFYFDRRQVNDAITYYKKVMKFKKHQAYPYSVYKLGWAYYNAQSKNDKEQSKYYKKAVTAFKLVVKLSDRDKKRKRRGLDLKDEAIRDLIMVWAEAEDVRSAWRYFRTIGEKGSFYTMLERLGQIYNEQGKNSKAIALYARILKEAPKRDSNPEIHAKLVDLHDRSGQIPQVVSRLKEMSDTYVGDSPWLGHNRKDKTLVSDAAKKAEHKLHYYGTLYHQRGQKAKDKTYLKSASAIYGIYLDKFADNPNTYDVRFYLAEILYDFKRYESASDHYLIVAKAKKNGKYTKPAALNAVAALNQNVLAKKFGKLPPAGQVRSPIGIPPAKEKLVSTIDEYVKLLPDQKEGHAMRFTAAQTYFDYGHYDKAIKRFDDITKEIPKTKQAKSAARVILGYHAEKQDWPNLIAWSRTISKRSSLMDKKMGTYVTGLLRTALFQRALAEEKAKKYDKSATSFLAFQKEFPTDKNADRAVFNASLNFYKVEDIESALKAGDLLLKKYPKSNTVPDTIANMATTYESLAQFESAAQKYQLLATSFPKDKRAPGALFNAALLYKGLQNKDRSLSLLKKFVATHSREPMAPDAYLELAGMYEAMGKHQDARNVYKDFAARFSKDKEQALFAEAKAAEIRTFHISAAKGEDELEKVAKKLVAKNAPLAFEARRTVAGSLFRLMGNKFSKYRSYSLKGGAKIEQQVGQKQALLVGLAKGYGKVIDLGNGEYSVASLYRLGEAHENFSKELFHAPGPKGASQKDLDAFKTELEKVAFPLKEEAYKFFETAHKRSKEVQTFTVWTKKTYQKMMSLAPDAHPDVNALAADPGYLSQTIKADKRVAELAE
jgi:TolA-binding protein